MVNDLTLIFSDLLELKINVYQFTYLHSKLGILWPRRAEQSWEWNTL